MKKSISIIKNAFSPILRLSIIVLLSTGVIACDSDSGSKHAPPFSESVRTEFTATVDAAYDAADYKNGISVAVYKHGYAVWTYATGCADCDEDAPVDMTPDTPTFAYSITKTFVSALVLTQIENGSYSLTDTVDDLLSSDADYNSLSTSQAGLLNTEATVEQLLTHKSGMPNYADNLTPLIGQCNPEATWKPVDILENIVYEDVNPAYIDDFRYSNTNYILLGMIAQVEGGATLNTLLENEFFSPLGLGAVIGPQDDYPENIAHPHDDLYILGVGSDNTFVDFSAAIQIVNETYDIYLGIGRGTWAAGGVIAIAEDIALWGWELYNDKGDAVTPTVRDVIKNSATENGEYGYGVVYDEFIYEDGTTGATYQHGGSAPGYRTLLSYENSKGISVAIITNTNHTDDGTGLINQYSLAEELLNAYVE